MGLSAPVFLPGVALEVATWLECCSSRMFFVPCVTAAAAASAPLDRFPSSPRSFDNRSCACVRACYRYVWKTTS